MSRSLRPGVWLTFSLVTLVTAGCSLDVTYIGSHYACAGARGCPTGYQCSSEGFCEVSATLPEPDAALVEDDADTTAPDADTHVADAASQDDADETIDAAQPADAALPPDAAQPADAALPPDAPPPPPPDAALPPDASLPPTTASLGATRDTQLYSPEPTLNFGHWAEIQCAARTTPSPAVDSPVLFGFNVATIPPGATVLSATMRLTVSGIALTSGQVSVFSLNEDWTEGAQDGTPGVANYNQRTAGASWSSPGARPPSRSSSAVATFPANHTETGFNITLPPSLVQNWVSHPNQNFGVILTCPIGQAVTFYTRLGGSTTQRPRLTVTYVAP